jgi:hypothetical protein
MAISDQLTDLATRTKRLEDIAADVRQQDRPVFEKAGENLPAAIEAEVRKVKSDDASMCIE